MCPWIFSLSAMPRLRGSTPSDHSTTPAAGVLGPTRTSAAAGSTPSFMSPSARGMAAAIALLRVGVQATPHRGPRQEQEKPPCRERGHPKLHGGHLPALGRRRNWDVGGVALLKSEPWEWVADPGRLSRL